MARLAKNFGGTVSDTFGFKNEKVLVTGGASIIGSHLVDALLEQGAGVHCASNNLRQFGCRGFWGKMTAELEAQNGEEKVGGAGEVKRRFGWVAEQDRDYGILPVARGLGALVLPVAGCFFTGRVGRF